jgi:hypothetical protein
LGTDTTQLTDSTKQENQQSSLNQPNPLQFSLQLSRGARRTQQAWEARPMTVRQRRELIKTYLRILLTELKAKEKAKPKLNALASDKIQ